MAEVEALRSRVAELEKNATQNPVVESGLPGSKERQFRDLAEASVQGFYIQDKFKLLFANRAAANLFGYENLAEFIEIESVLDLLAPHERARARDFNTRRRAKKEVPRQVEFEALRKDGTLFWMEFVVQVVIWEGREAVQSTMVDISERKRAEEKLRESQRLLQTVFDTIPDLLYVKDSEARLLMANKSWYEFFGVSVKEPIGSSVSDLQGPSEEEKSQFRASDEAVFSTGKVFEIPEQSMTPSSGEMRFFDIRKTPFFDDQGRVQGLVGLSMDISKRKNAEEALQQSESKFRDLVETSHDLIWRSDEEGRFTYLNPAWEKILGYTTEEMLGRLYTDFKAGDRATKSLRVHKEILAGRSWVNRESIYHTKTGEERVLNFNAIPIFNSHGKGIGAKGSAQDVTDQRRAEEDLRASKRLLETVFNTLPHSLFVRDANSIFLMVNRKLANRYGIEPEDLKGIHIKELPFATEAQKAQFIEDDRKVLETGRQTVNHEFPVLQTDGSTRYFNNSIQPLRGDDGEIIGLVGVAEDITDRKRVEAQLRDAQKMEAVGQLAGGIAHEFNNMLHVIISSVYFARKNLHDPGKVEKDLNTILKSAERSAELTNQLLAFGRKTTIAPATLNLNELTGNLVKMVRSIIGEEISLEFKPGQDIFFVKADAGMLEQVLINLCVNARDAMPGGGRLTVETRNHHADEAFCHTHGFKEPGDTVMVSVSDNGTGMSPEIRDRIFEPFFTTKDIGRGTGLGLSMVHGIIQQHGGVIEVNSQPEVGSTFNIYLPRDSSPVQKQGVPIAAKVSGGKETILVAEDEKDVLEMLKQVLETSGYQVLVARDGEDALSMFKENVNRIDLVFLDMVMPKLRGWEVFQRIRESGSKVPVLFSTGYSLDSSDAESVSQSGLRTIQKPYSPDALFLAIREVIDQG